MRYDDQNLREMLAAEYVLGTLRGGARRRYESLQIARPDWQQATAWWAGRIHLLAETAPAAEPPAKVWRGIEARLHGGKQATAARWWRAFALSSSGLAVALAFLLGVNLLREPAVPVIVTEPATVAILNNEEAKPAWMLSLSRKADGSSAMRVVTLPGAAPVAGKSFELWVLPADKSPPVSLGLLPVEGTRLLRVADELVPALENGGLAVSLEPEGGSPTGQPTGAVLYQGKLIQI
jgi:anti-sigma-K factor RskA